MSNEMPAELDRERRVFEANYPTWVASPESRGKFVLIKGDEVIGFYDTLDAAFAAGTERFGLDDFFIDAIAPPAPTHVTFLGQAV